MSPANAARRYFARKRQAVDAGIILAAVVLAGCASDADRMWVDAKINGKSAHMAVDTGATISFLNRAAAEDLGLKITEPPPGVIAPPGRVLAGMTEPCDLTFWGTTIRTSLGVNKDPRYVKWEMEGVIGWSQVRDKILLFDALTRQIRPLDKLPDDVATWTRLRIFPNANIMAMEAPGYQGEMGVICVDTGSPTGVELSPRRWREWRDGHPREPFTLFAYYTPGSGLVTIEQAWARELPLGPLTLTDVPIEESNPSITAIGYGPNVVTFGMAALKRLDMVLDGPHGVVYLRPKPPPGEPFEHNRLGAVFTPLDSTSEFLVAHVVKGGPAYEAGVRDGDMLTYINGFKTTNWTDDPVIGIPNFEWPAGDKVYLRLLRGTKEYRVNVRLRDIIGPDSPDYDSTPAPAPLPRK